jgi:hypothetical protein
MNTSAITDLQEIVMAMVSIVGKMVVVVVEVLHMPSTCASNFVMFSLESGKVRILNPLCYTSQLHQSACSLFSVV